jgi:hypothetical protein
MKHFILFTAAASLIAGAEILHMAPGSAQQAGSLKTINAKSLCGTWQALPGSGGSHQLTTSNGKAKGSGLDRDGDAVKYTIADANTRTAVAVQTINMKQGQSYHMGEGFKAKTARKLVGVTKQNMILFAVQGETNTEVWTPVSPGTYDVAGIETGPHAMAYYYTVKQTLKTSCQAD